ncbi:DSHCT domain-containing protein [Xylariaceae sp. FL0804]|nr:DSHCT domain-containing protein [Xylariaceae sp. FL0804]
MASQASKRKASPPRKPLNNRIDNYDIDDDPFAWLNDDEPQKASGELNKGTEAADLGISEEVKIAKKPRVPRVKLDEARLLSEKGIPRLRRKAGQLKFKGKGHEFSDAARLLSLYQLWLDDLFPKAKFLDALAMVEKTGHTNYMKLQREGWIEEGRPKPSVTADDDDIFGDTNQAEERDPAIFPARVAPIFQAQGQSSERPKTPTRNDPLDDDDDIYGATPIRPTTTAATATEKSIFGNAGKDLEPDEDELDALMAEEENQRTAPASLFGHGNMPRRPAAEPDEDDDLDALMAEAEAESGPKAPNGPSSAAAKPPAATVDGDEDDLDALMAEAEADGQAFGDASGPRPGAKMSEANTARDKVADDDEEAAMAEMDGLCACHCRQTCCCREAKLKTDSTQSDVNIDDILFQQGPRKRLKQNPAALKADLEQSFLSPSHEFSTDWLNRLQQRWESTPDLTEMFRIAPTQTRTVTRFQRQGLEGRVTGYKNVTLPANSATAKNSTSLMRKPGGRADFVRGAAGFFPFAPGGLEGVEATAAMEDQMARSTAVGAEGSRNKLDRVIQLSAEGHGLLEVAPGLDRGIDFSQKKTTVNEKAAKAIEAELDQEPEDGPEKENGDDQAEVDGVEEELNGEEDEDIDALLPVEFPALEPRGKLAASSARKAGREWAHMVDITRGIPNFHELVPDMAREWPFELDTFQKEAIYHLENGDSVFVAAHTSAGKTVVAEYAIALAARHMTKAIYTSPIKALSNQKFRDFRQTFDEVGILTGDVQINPEASCLIMTTEILRSMLYRGADLIRDVEFVIFDEVHYVNDFERGVVWEEVIIMLPEHVSLILLSATVPNTKEFASWVGRTKQKDIYVISTPKRPVPLEHYLWASKNIYKIVDPNKKFLEKGWKEADQALRGRDKALPAPAARGGGNQRGNQRGGAQRGGQQRGGQRGGSQQRGRGGPPRASHTPGHMGRAGRPGGFTSANQDKNLWVHLVQFLKKSTLLPACIFVFSKKRCEENADALSNQDFCTAKEKSHIHMIFQRSIARLRPEDRVLPQIIRLKELLSRGIAVHHGGLLPIVKEIVEILFAHTLVKVLFATETFAMGLNLPTRTVVFSGYRKHDGHSFRNLLPGEYTQMAGRAGRRGLDTVGSVIIVPPASGDEAPPVADLQKMILDPPSKLRSQFRLTYNMILNLLRVEALKIEEMIKRSFSEHATQQLLPEHEKAVKLSEADLAKVKREPCQICDETMDTCHQAAMDYKQSTQELYKALLTIPIGKKMFSQSRLIVWNKDGVRTPGILLSEGASTKLSSGGQPTVHVFEIKSGRETRDSTDLLPFVPSFAGLLKPLPQQKKLIYGKTLHVPLDDIECLTGHVATGIVPDYFHGTEPKQAAKDKMLKICKAGWEASIWEEISFNKIRNMNIQELLQKREKEAALIKESAPLQCPKFLKHFAMCHDQWLIQEHISSLRQALSDQNLQLLPDYEQRIEVLKDLSFIDADARIQLKGKVACEIHSADELVLTELILDNVLAEYEPAEIAALLSAFVFQEKTESVPRLTGPLERGMQAIVAISEKVNAVQTERQVIQSAEDSNDFVSRPRFGLVEVVYEWARGMSFRSITDLTDVLEGTVVRTITRLDETCREVKNAARIVGDPDLYQKMQQAQEMIKRDITAVASLYM